MAQRSHVPKFGNWESEQDVPYTAYFDKARKGRTGTKIINPNDPEGNQNNDDSSETRAPPPKPEPEETRAGRVREEGVRRTSEAAARNDNVGPKAVVGDQRYGGCGVSSGEGPRRPSGPRVGSEQSVEKSPLHPHARAYGRGAGNSPSWEGKSSYESSHGTPGRSRMKPTTRGDESPDKGAAVPKFGEWDENNPASADGYTHIFNKVREERQSGGGRVPDINTDSSYNHGRKPPASSGSKICCFPWGRK